MMKNIHLFVSITVSVNVERKKETENFVTCYGSYLDYNLGNTISSTPNEYSNTLKLYLATLYMHIL